MRQHLSRAERHGRSRSRDARKPRKDRKWAGNEPENIQESVLSDDTEVKENEAEILSSSLELSHSEYQDNDSVLEVGDMPSRKKLYPSQRLIWTRWFYNSLLTIFIVIMIALLWWGLNESPWGKGAVNHN